MIPGQRELSQKALTDSFVSVFTELRRLQELNAEMLEALSKIIRRINGATDVDRLCLDIREIARAAIEKTEVKP